MKVGEGNFYRFLLKKESLSKSPEGCFSFLIFFGLFCNVDWIQMTQLLGLKFPWATCLRKNRK